MKTVILLGCLAVSSIFASDARRTAFNSDFERLLPLNASSEELHLIIEQKLLVTSANCGRMIHMYVGPDEGESSVSLYCDSLEAPNSICHVTVTKALGSFEYVMSEHDDKDELLRYLREVPVERKDADIPHSTALAFRSCLMAMMPKSGDSFQAPTISDNDRIEFWITEPGALPRGGQRGERPGKRITTLVHIGDLLSRYCEAAPQERAAIAKKIEKEATRLLATRERKPRAKK